MTVGRHGNEDWPGVTSLACTLCDHRGKLAMWMDEFVVLLDLMKNRSETHKSRLVKNEALTRSSLIEPLLQALGWDVHDPSHVVPEFITGTSKKGVADYALFGDSLDVPKVFVEAKSLGRSLSDGLDQSITYCVSAGVLYFVISDGLRWNAYETFRKVPTEQKLLFEVDLRTGSDHEHVMKLLWLWRGNFVDDVDPTSPLIPKEKSEAEANKGTVTAPVSTPQPVAGPSAPNGSPIRNVLKKLRISTGQAPPARIRFPDGKDAVIKSWSDVLTETVTWLVGNGRLSAAECPVVTSRGSRIVHTSPVRSNGASFATPHQVEGLWIDRNWSAMNHVRLAAEVLSRFQVDLNAVRLM